MLISWTNLDLIRIVFMSCVFALGSVLCVRFLQMSHRSSHGKELVIDLSSSPISKQTQHSSLDSNNERFKTPLDSQTFSSIFKEAPTVVERIVRFDTLGSTFIPRIFENKDWANLFENFEDPIDELVKELYSNARCTEVELKCWVRGKEYSSSLQITLQRSFESIDQ